MLDNKQKGVFGVVDKTSQVNIIAEVSLLPGFFPIIFLSQLFRKIFLNNSTNIKCLKNENRKRKEERKKTNKKNASQLVLF